MSAVPVFPCRKAGDDGQLPGRSPAPEKIPGGGGSKAELKLPPAWTTKTKIVRLGMKVAEVPYLVTTERDGRADSEEDGLSKGSPRLTTVHSDRSKLQRDLGPFFMLMTVVTFSVVPRSEFNGFATDSHL